MCEPSNAARSRQNHRIETKQKRSGFRSILTYISLCHIHRPRQGLALSTVDSRVVHKPEKRGALPSYRTPALTILPSCECLSFATFSHPLYKYFISFLALAPYYHLPHLPTKKRVKRSPLCLCSWFSFDQFSLDQHLFQLSRLVHL